MKALKTYILIVLSGLLGGCYTVTETPGAVGRVIDADTGIPVRGAHITPQGLPAAGVISGRGGEFNLRPATHTQIAFMYLHNPEFMTGSFLVIAPGYATNKLQGDATSHSLWRVDLGKVALNRP